MSFCMSVSPGMGSARYLWTNADDRLPVDPLGRVEGGDGIVEGRDGADVCPQPTVTHPRGDLTQLGPREQTKTKPTARPSPGRASGGPATVTSVPPARTRPADRFPMLPPKTSKTRSTPPTFSSPSSSSATNSCAPKSSAG